MDVCFVLLTRARVSLGVNDARIMMARMHGVWRRGSMQNRYRAVGAGYPGLAGWLANSSHGAMEAVRRIRRVRFCMHFCMAVDSVMKLNFTAPGSHLELRRASSRSTY